MTKDNKSKSESYVIFLLKALSSVFQKPLFPFDLEGFFYAKILNLSELGSFRFVSAKYSYDIEMLEHDDLVLRRFYKGEDEIVFSCRQGVPKILVFDDWIIDFSANLKGR